MLCYLEGLTNEEAAFRLRWPVGTVKVRLHRAREKLQVRLTRRGLAPAVGLLGAASSADAKVLVSPALIELTVRAASSRTLIGVVTASVISLTEGALRTMMLTKLKLAAMGILSLGAVTIGAGAILGQDRAKAGLDAAFSSEKKAPDVAPEREDVEATKTRLLKELRLRLDADQKYYDEGRLTSNRLIDSMERLLSAEQQVAATKSERLRALEVYIQRVEHLLPGARADLEKARAAKSGGSAEANAEIQRGLQREISEIQIHLDAATLRLAAESDAANGAGEGEKPLPDRSGGGVEDTATLKAKQLKLAQQALRDLDLMHKGEGLSRTDPRFALWERRQLEAIRATGAGKAELLAALEIYLKRIKEQERLAQLALEKGEGARVDLWDAQYRVLEAEMWLIQERAR